MKIFIYKTLIVIFSIYFLFQFTVGLKLREYENKLENLLYNKQAREQIIEKIKDEIESANQKSFFPINEIYRTYSFAGWRILCTMVEHA